MQTHDVVIVGGGPAGSSCAWRLVQQGLDVLVIDRAQFPRDKLCAGWITPQVVDELELDVDVYTRRHVWQPITGFRCGIVGRGTIGVPYGRTVSYGIRRCEFDTYLLHRSGARLEQGAAVRSIERRDGRWVVNDQFAAPMLVGAGGAGCPVARKLAGGAVRDKESLVAAQEVEFLLPDESQTNVDRHVPELYFCQDLKGYAWCFRKGDYLNVGLGRVGQADLRRHMERFEEDFKSRTGWRGPLPGRFRGHSYRLYRGTQRLTDDGVALIGDAAGLAYAQSGEGIRPAIESGLMAADTILAARGDYRRARLRDYEERLAARLGAPHSGAAGGWLPSSWTQALGARLLRSDWFVRRVVLNRWFLRGSDAALVSAQ